MTRPPFLARPPLLALLFVGAVAGCSGDTKPAPDRGPSPIAVKLTIRSVPSGAAVFDQGRDRLGVTPLTLDEKAGDQLHLMLVKDGFRAARRSFFVERRPKQSLVVKLRKQSGLLVIKTGLIRGADVYVDGKRRGKSPLKVPLPLGTHTVEVRRKGTAPFNATVKLSKPKQKVVVNARLLGPGDKTRPTGLLTVLSDQRAVVTSGKTLFGTTPLRRIAVPARRYRLKLEAFKTKMVREVTVVVKVKAHASVRVTFAETGKTGATTKR
ncbi:MAG: hypothetical protein CSA24_01250 [Deltaproteobacteria bacterium]|nr:MAG: hypothetical protein CSA24_01250 [Deltaproteobacteria bacterium]